MNIVSVPSATEPLSFNSTLVSSGTSTQVLSSSAFSTFITSTGVSPVPTSGSSSVSLDLTAVPVNRTQVITSAASTSFPVSSSGQTISSPSSAISEASALPTSVSFSSSAAARSSGLPVPPGDPTDTSAPAQDSLPSSESITSLVIPSSTARSASASFPRGVVSNPATPTTSEVVTPTSAMSTPTASATVPITDKNPSTPQTDPAPSPGTTSEATEVTSPSSAPSQPASSPASKASSEPSSPTAAPSKPASSPSSPASESKPASQAPSRPTNVESASVTPSAAPASPSQAPSVVLSQTAGRVQQQSATSAPPIDEQSVAPSAATGSPAPSPNTPSVSGVSDISSFLGQANAQTATIISTITDKPETTLTSPIFVTTTDSKGHTTVSEPPFFASVALTTLPDGQLVSTTHIIANPTGIWGVNDQSGTTRGFFANTGAVAGVFLVVGIVSAVFIAGLCYFFHKKRRRQRIRHSISRPLPYPDNPFEDPRDTPSPTQTQMRYAPDSTHRNLVGAGLGLSGSQQLQPQPRHLLDDEISEDGIQNPVTPKNLQFSGPQVPEQAHGLGLAGVGSGNRSVSKADYTGPFSDYYNNTRPTHQQKPSFQSEIGLAITTEQTQHAEGPYPIIPQVAVVRPSSTESSPSIYPASLPPVAAEEFEHGHIMEPVGLSPPPPPPERRRPPVLTLQKSNSDSVSPIVSPRVPLLPPRNPLRTSQHEASKLLSRTHPGSEQDRFSQLGFRTYEPLTPPDSSPPSAVSHDGGSQRSGSSERRNPFSDMNESSDDGGKPHVIPSPVRDTFYTRRKNLEVRPSSSVEWKQ